MIASLPMYAHPSNRGAHDHLWALIRDRLRAAGIAAPDALDHDIDHKDGWARDDLVLGHICNLPYRKQFRDRVTLIGASDYGLTDCPAGYYRSVVVVRADAASKPPASYANARFVCNDTLSHSGYGAAQDWAQRHGFQLPVHTITGSHQASIDAIARGDADLATIDALTWRMALDHNPATSKLAVIDHTRRTPGMTFITRKGQDPRPYFAAISSAIAGLPKDAARQLGLRSIIRLPDSAYDLPFPPHAAVFRT